MCSEVIGPVQASKAGADSKRLKTPASTTRANAESVSTPSIRDNVCGALPLINAL